MTGAPRLETSPSSPQEQSAGGVDIGRSGAAADQLAVEVWREARQAIGRFDGLLADTRKYGFTLIALLLSAGAIAKSANGGAPNLLGVSTIVLALLVILFGIDRYYWLLLQVSVQLAEALEHQLPLQGRLTAGLRQAMRASRISFFVLAAYPGFMIISVALSFATQTSVRERVSAVSVGFTFVVLFFVINNLAERAKDVAVDSAFQVADLAKPPKRPKPKMSGVFLPKWANASRTKAKGSSSEQPSSTSNQRT